MGASMKTVAYLTEGELECLYCAQVEAADLMAGHTVAIQRSEYSDEHFEDPLLGACCAYCGVDLSPAMPSNDNVEPTGLEHAYLWEALDSVMPCKGEGYSLADLGAVDYVKHSALVAVRERCWQYLRERSPGYLSQSEEERIASVLWAQDEPTANPEAWLEPGWYKQSEAHDSDECNCYDSEGYPKD